MLDHERALVDLCSDEGTESDLEVEQCVLEFLQDGYYSMDENDDDNNSAEDEEEECDPQDDADCLVDDLYSMWAEDMAVPSATTTTLDGDGENSNNGDGAVAGAVNNGSKPTKPWSSRSSPSGTYVRDPVTGEMKNIDAE